MAGKGFLCTFALFFMRGYKMSNPQCSHKELRHDREELKARIIDVAFAAFTREGIKAVRMDDLSATLGISKRTLYEVFSDKEELLLECIKHHHIQSRQELFAYASQETDIVKILWTFFLKKVTDLENMNPRYFVELLRYEKIREFQQQCRENDREATMKFYQKGISQGFFRQDVNFDIYHSLMSVMADGFVHTTVEIPYSMTEILKVFISVNLRGICTDKGLRQLKELAEE